MKLILDAKARGHPAYTQVDEVKVHERAAKLPVDAVPEQLFGALLVNDDSIDKLRPQKAATPVDGRVAPAAAFQDARPHAVMQERSCADVADINEQRLPTLQHTVQQLPADPHGSQETRAMRAVSGSAPGSECGRCAAMIR